MTSALPLEEFHDSRDDEAGAEGPETQGIAVSATPETEEADSE